jgi:hypothetical protein
MTRNHHLGNNALVIAAGMPRSASTWLYNAAQLVLSADPEIAGDLSVGWIRDWEHLRDTRYRLIKVHDFHPILVDRACFTLYSFRDLRDVLASMKRGLDREPSLKLADTLIRHYHQWREKADIVVRYETMLEAKESTIYALAGLFGISGIEPAAITKQLDSLAFRSKEQKSHTYDKITLYHWNHITDGRHGSWADTLDSTLVKHIEKKYRSWFEANGYPIV